MAEHFNSYFTGLAKSLSSKRQPSKNNFRDYLLPSSPKIICSNTNLPQELIAINKTLKSTHTFGTDAEEILLRHVHKLVTNKEATPFSSVFQLADRSGLRGHRY